MFRCFYSKGHKLSFVVHKINNSTLILSCILKQLLINSKHKNYSWFTLILKLMVYVNITVHNNWSLVSRENMYSYENEGLC